MGALTNKNFPFELRNWEIEKIKHFDPTDSFAFDIKLLVYNNKIIQIEPNYLEELFKDNFINDRSRHFFNGLENLNQIYISNSSNLINILKNLMKIVYVSELSFLKHKKINSFYIIYENLSLDILCLLSFFKKRYYFIKLKQIENLKLDNNLEYKFLINNINFENSNFCLLIGINTRIESTNLNLKIRQRKIKGNFKILSLSSYIKSTYNLEIIGNSIKNLKLIIEGLNFICQDFHLKENPIILLNSEILNNRSDIKAIESGFFYLNTFIKFCSVNIINSNIYKIGINLTNCFTKINNNQFSSIYFLNVFNNNNIINYILNINSIYMQENKAISIKKSYIDQNFSFITNNLEKKTINYFYLPIKTLFDETQLFINTQGLLKKSSKIFVNKNKIKSNWKILRQLFNNLDKKISLLNQRNLIFFDLTKRFNFLKIIFFLFKSKKIETKNYICNNLNPFILKTNKIISNKKIKFLNSKTKFWLNDFFIGNKDNLNKKSLVLINYSNQNRIQKTNFF